MTFKDWFFGTNPEYQVPCDGRWGLLHICVLVFSIIAIVALALIFRSKNKKAKEIVIFVLAMIILFLEITRRVKNLILHGFGDVDQLLYILLPRPWCAISCWMIISSVFVKKKFFYNITSITSLLCAVIFFAYPGAGFNDVYILFENVYSISTHALLLITSITMITLKAVDFKYVREKESMIYEMITLAGIFAYAFLEIYVLKVESDPLYFMPDNDVMEILGVSHPIYIIIYILFLGLWVNSFYLIPYIIRKCGSKKHESRNV